jgi:hypothetical protein
MLLLQESSLLYEAIRFSPCLRVQVLLVVLLMFHDPGSSQIQTAAYTRNRNSSERDDLLSALIVQRYTLPTLLDTAICAFPPADDPFRSMRLRIPLASLDPTSANLTVTPERALYARVPCPVFLYTKVGKKLHATIGAPLQHTAPLFPLKTAVACVCNSCAFNVLPSHVRVLFSWATQSEYLNCRVIAACKHFLSRMFALPSRSLFLNSTTLHPQTQFNFPSQNNGGF